MALEFEVDSVDSLDEAVKGLYKQHENGKYRLDVTGIDPADNLKGALNKEREERRLAKQKADELQKQLEAKEQAELESQKKYEDLYKRAQETGSKSAAELAALKKQIADKEVDAEAAKIAGALTRDAKKLAVLQKEIRALAEHTGEGVRFKGDAGELTAEQVSKLVSEQYPFLVDGNQSSGGGANGSGGSKGVGQVSRTEFDKMNPAQKQEFMRKGGTLTD